ncbi:glycosyltransferase family 4 protein [Modestobacter sp. VKM Ac-2984]|uniref:glycosyltransferase family 4 protein n=1 Tax=Modestobacter sp. VKM Ac-2984 TaxID=3004138 RepID=UPI0022AAA6BB|nr:glycosyltransferase family 1 protein [Modestobacter sp. VKM Ac-2984]MCZ2816410.1 glycosyltransferase family 1 protein [Modestobacter sp. VKM Ac-2984]
MRVGLLLEQVLSPVPGGTGRYAVEVAGALAATGGPGTEVTGWTAWHRRVAGAVVPGVGGPHRLPLPRRPLVAAWERGPLPAPRGVDLVHAPTPLAPLGGRRPVVVTVHDAVPWTHPETLTPRGVRWHRRMIGRAASSAAAVVVPTEAVARELRRHLTLRCPLVVVGEGVSGRLTLPSDALARQAALGLTPGGYLLTTATLEPRKGLDVLVGALAGAGAPDLPLVVVGQPGWGDVDVPALVAAAGLPAGRVRTLGRVPDEDLAALLGGATALVVPSRAEGFGLPVLEGMAAGVPVVTSDDPALVEVGGGSTVVTPVGDRVALAAALGRVAGDEQLRRDLVRRGRTRAADFSWTGAATRLWELYRELVPTGAG